MSHAKRQMMMLGAGATLLLAGVYTWVTRRPMVTDDEVREATRDTLATRERLLTVRCERPPMFGDAADDALPLATLLSPSGPFAACWQAASPDELNDALGVNPWADASDAADYAERETTGENYLAPGGAPYAEEHLPEVFRDVLARCADLPEELARQARTPNRCSPATPGSELWTAQVDDTEASLINAVYLARAASVLARRRAGGDLEGALTLLVQAMATIQDVGRGPASMLPAMLGVVAQGVAVAGMQTLLFSATPSAETAQRVSAALQVLESTDPQPGALLVVDSLMVLDVGLRAVPAEDRGFMVFSMASLHRRLQRVCPIGAPVDACLETLPFPAPGAANAFVALFGGRAQRDHLIAEIDAATTSSAHRFLARHARSRLQLAALRTLLTLVRERAEGACPPRPPAPPYTVAHGSDESAFRVMAYNDRSYELLGPQRGGERDVLMFTCPAFEGQWGGADATTDDPNDEALP